MFSDDMQFAMLVYAAMLVMLGCNRHCFAQGTVGCALCLLPFGWIIWKRRRYRSCYDGLRMPVRQCGLLVVLEVQPDHSSPSMQGLMECDRLQAATSQGGVCVQ